MPEDQFEFAIAVVGAMNPAIHVSDWYQTVLKVITPEEQRAIKSNPHFLLTSVASQFAAPTFRLVCTETKWLMSTSQDHLSRIADIACKVFETLDHTPVSAFGINIDRHRPTNIEDVPQRLCKRIESLVPQLGNDEMIRGTLRFSCRSGDRVVNAAIEPSAVEASRLFVGLNYHYAITADEYRHFDLSAMIRSAVKQDVEDSSTRARLIASSILASEGSA